jgi:hypothetical protein
MARRANRGCGGKKNLKVNLKEVENTRKDASRSFDCDVDVSEEEDNFESLVCGDQFEMDAQRLPGIQSSVVGLGIDELEISDCPDGEVPIVLETSGVKLGISKDVRKVVSEHKNLVQDWRKLFWSEKPVGNLQFFAPSQEDGRVVVKPPKEANEEGILKWSSSLVGQFLNISLCVIIQ